MKTSEQAQIIAGYLKSKLPVISIEHEWDANLQIEWYFIGYNDRTIRLVVPGVFFDSISADEINKKLESLRLADGIENLKTEYIIINNSGSGYETF